MAPLRARFTVPATLRDMAATVLDAAGVQGRDVGIRGESWLTARGAGSPVISEVSAGINALPSQPVSRGAMRSLLTDSTHYIRNGDGVEELYFWRTDPAQAHDAASVSGSIVPRLRESLAAVFR